MSSVRLTAAMLAVSAGTVLAGCSGSDAPESREPKSVDRPVSGIASYVALGDSFVAGPGISAVQAGSGICMRSKRNYPTLIAHQLGIEDFHDASCIGATTTSVLKDVKLGDGSTFPSQIKSVARDTDLVTIGIGGNDSGLYTGMFKACYIPTTTTDDSCVDYARAVPSLLEKTRKNIGRVLDAVHEVAPHAKVILVGYLRVVPDSGTCDAIPVPAADVALAAAGERKLDSTLRDAAGDAGVTYVSPRSAASGHDACAGTRAWVNGIDSSSGDGVLLHPRAEGMQAVADDVLAAIRAS